MVWVIGVLALALSGGVALGVYAVALGHRVADIGSEVEKLTRRGDELRTLVDQLQLPSSRRD